MRPAEDDVHEFLGLHAHLTRLEHEAETVARELREGGLTTARSKVTNNKADGGGGEEVMITINE